MKLGRNDTKKREELGNRVSSLLSVELLRSSEEGFSGLLDAITNLGLSGSREQIIRLTPAMSAKLQSKVAKAVASFVRDSEKNEAQIAVNTATLNALAKALDVADRQKMAIEAMGHIKAGGSNPSLRTVLESAVAIGEQPGAMAGVHHIVATLYKRKDVVDKLGSNVSQWQTFLSEDGPRFTYYFDAVQWYEANKNKTRIADGGIKENRAKAEEVQPELQRWIEGNEALIPLGLHKSHVERLHHDVNKFKRNLIHSDIN